MPFGWLRELTWITDYFGIITQAFYGRLSLGFGCISVFLLFFKFLGRYKFEKLRNISRQALRTFSSETVDNCFTVTLTAPLEIRSPSERLSTRPLRVNFGLFVRFLVL